MEDEYRGDSEYLECLDASRLETGIIYYYLFSEVPGVAIKPPMVDIYKVFVQSTSQGSRCLRSDTLLLYKATK